MSTIGVDARRDTKNTDYDAAQALLDLQSNKKPEANAESYGWRDMDSKEDIERAAKLILSCFISSDVPGKDSPYDKHVKTHFPLTPKSSKNASQNYHSKVKTTEPSNITPKFYVKESNNISSSNIMEIYSKQSKKTGRKCNTRDAETQTEEQYFNPNIQLMETTIKNLCQRIKLLETQIKTSLDQSVDEASFETVDRVLDFSDENIDQDPDYELTFDDLEPVNKTKYSRTSEFDSSAFNDSRRRQTNKNVVYNGILTNINASSYDLVPIGEGNATVPSRLLKHINWNSYSSATRKLLTAVFSRRILATHSLTGKPSPAFPNKPAKKRLDPVLVRDIVQTVVERCRVPENVVRTSITTKCADESKMFRTREKNKKKRSNKKNRENIPPTTSDSESDD